MVNIAFRKGSFYRLELVDYADRGGRAEKPPTPSVLGSDSIMISRILNWLFAAFLASPVLEIHEATVAALLPRETEPQWQPSHRVLKR